MADKSKLKEKKSKKPEQKKGSSKGKAPKTSKPEVKIPNRLFDVYKNEIIPYLMKTFSYKSIMQAPKVDKIVVNMGIGAAVGEPKILEEAVKELEAVTGQKASIRKAKKSISNFKLREGVSIGAMVTLRHERMYEFLDRFINVALPRVRDFRGLSDKSFDGRGNYTIGVKEQIIFPEINVDKITRIMGMDVTIVTNANSDNEAYELLKSFGMPFIKKEIKTA
ncbi:MAG: 50S ribosomal protein L5 [Ignavibacteria bacterium]|nr:50S ribosomal protein L5 [Ignavibacteria bacterium]MBT8383852.1 50S ribosomal protein L5 [Ignavibacteria bacterium]MBT8392066.1 50S ribosomal protein L5 [Ignavibacteria bacterium]NNJ54047.1 50S ribosomal protein L5 [Ignavibacteriaceae bacterium]NNL20993.1 50S ribosomal protein L5 [Ignavibacteriaceae bacterium]